MHFLEDERSKPCCSLVRGTRDREIVVIRLPELLEDRLRLAARIDEHKRRFVALDQLIDFTERMTRRMASPS